MRLTAACRQGWNSPEPPPRAALQLSMGLRPSKGQLGTGVMVGRAVTGTVAKLMAHGRQLVRLASWG